MRLLSTALIGILTLTGTGAFLAHLVWLCRQRMLLQRVKQRWQSPELRDAIRGSVPASGVVREVASLPPGWAKERVQDLIRIRPGGYEAAAALCRLDCARKAWPIRVLYAMSTGAFVLGLGKVVFSTLLAGSPVSGQWLAGVRGTGEAFLGALCLIALGGLLALAQRSVMLDLERFTLLELGPLLLVSDERASTERFADRLEASSRRLEAATQPLAEGVERLAERLTDSIGAFVPCLDHAAQNILHAVEGMRQAATDLQLGTGTFEESYAGVAETYARLEQLAGGVTGSQAAQQERLSEIATGLHGITESLTTVVAGANESQRVVSGMAGAVVAATQSMERMTDQLRSSVDRLTTEFSTGKTGATLTEGVTLRRLAEQQQQFINLLDHRMGREDRQATARR